MKHIPLLVIATYLLGSATPVTAQNAVNTEPKLPKVSLSTTYQSGFIAARINRLITPDPTVWTNVAFTWKSGFAFSWTEIHGIDDTDWSSGPTDETHVSIGKTWKIDAFDFKLEATLINISPVERWADHDRYSFDTYLSRTFTYGKNGTQSITPELRVLWFCNTQAIGSGVPVIMPSVTYRCKHLFGFDQLNAYSKFAVCWDGGLGRNDTAGIFLQGDTGLQWNLESVLKRPATLTLPGYKFITPITHGNDGRDETHHVFYTGLRFDF